MMLIRKGTGEDPRLIEKDKVHYLEFEALKKQSWLTHAFSTRLGCVSSGCFAFSAMKASLSIKSKISMSFPSSLSLSLKKVHDGFSVGSRFIQVQSFIVPGKGDSFRVF